MKKVIVLFDAATDIEKGRNFYNKIDPGQGITLSDPSFPI